MREQNQREAAQSGGKGPVNGESDRADAAEAPRFLAAGAGTGYRISLEAVRAAAMGLRGNSVVITDRAGTVLWVNPAFTRVTGYTAVEAVGSNPRLWSSGQHPKEFYKQLWDTILAGRAWQGTIINRRKEGSLYSEEMTILPILSPAGDLVNFVSIKQDVTQHEHDTEMLRQSEERYGRLVANLLDVTWTAAENGHTTYISRNVESVYGFSAEEICERGEELWFGRIHPDDLARVSQAFQNLFANDQSFDAEYRVQRKDGEWSLDSRPGAADPRGKRGALCRWCFLRHHGAQAGGAGGAGLRKALPAFVRKQPVRGFPGGSRRQAAAMQSCAGQHAGLRLARGTAAAEHKRHSVRR